VRKLLTILLCVVSLSACAVNSETVVPVTSSERLVQAAGAYLALNATVNTALDYGLIRGAQATQVKLALASARQALRAWRLFPNSVDAEDKWLIALQAANSLVKAIQPPPRPVTYLVFNQSFLEANIL